MDMNLRKLQEIVKDKGVWCAAVLGVTKSQTWLGDWITTTPWEHLVFESHEKTKIVLENSKNTQK